MVAHAHALTPVMIRYVRDRSAGNVLTTDADIEQTSHRTRMRSRVVFFFSSRRRHTRFDCDWSSDVCSSDLPEAVTLLEGITAHSPSPVLLDLLGDARTQTHELAKAEEAYRKAEELDPSEIGRASCRERV